MTTTCADLRPQLSAYVDRDLDPEKVNDIRAHLSACEACRGIAADLERLRDVARNLGPIQPPAHLWLEIVGRVRQEGGAPDPVAPPPPVQADTRPGEGKWQWLGLAAALTLVTLGVYTVGQPDQTESPAMVDAGAGNASDVPTVETVEETMRRAEAEYEKAIVQLEQVLQNGDPDVSVSAVAILQRNLTTIDSAIAETRAALTEDPESQPARVSLFEALRNKVNLLQHTVVLMNEMRKGDASGAAEAVAGLAGPGRGTL